MTHGTRRTYQQGCHCPCCTAANATYIAQIRQQHHRGRTPLGAYVSAQEAARLVQGLLRERFRKAQVAPIAGLEKQTLSRRMTPQQRIRLKTLLKVRRVYRMLIVESDQRAIENPPNV